jgi:spore germination protein GerM
MNEPRSPQRSRPSVRRPPKQPRKKKRGSGRFLWLVVFAAVAVGAWWFLQHGGDQESGEDFADLGTGGVVDTPLAGDRAVVLVFPEWDASGYVTEERQIPSRDRPGEDLLGLITVLCDGPKISGAISALPSGTRSLGAFVNPEDQSVVLDFSQELVTGHPGGSAAEVATLTSILRTVALNFPGTRSCVILIEGAQVETLAGNLDMVRPFDPRRWL